jgi:hypothetical protein
MNANKDNHARKRLREWWATPPRPGLQRLINPWEYRHVRAFAIARIVGGFVAVTAGFICLSYDVYGWAAFFLVVGTLDLGAGYWFTAIARSHHYRSLPTW